MLFALCNVVTLWICAATHSPETVVSLCSCPNRLTVPSPLSTSLAASVTAEIKENHAEMRGSRSHAG